MDRLNTREVLLVLGPNDTVLWSDASDSPVALPDSRARWEAIWSRREQVVEIAHTHPVGPARFSHEDETTMAALDAALGRPLCYSVISPKGMVRRDPETPGDALVDDPPWWVALARLASGIQPSKGT